MTGKIHQKRRKFVLFLIQVERCLIFEKTFNSRNFDKLTGYGSLEKGNMFFKGKIIYRKVNKKIWLTKLSFYRKNKKMERYFRKCSTNCMGVFSGLLGLKKILSTQAHGIPVKYFIF